MAPLRRILALWLPRLPTDRLERRRPEPRARLLAAVAGERGRRVLRAVNAAAEAAGFAPGMGLADARAAEPGLEAVEADPAADAAALDRIAAWCVRYSPWVALDGPDGILVDATGCAHLFGGEAAMLEDLAGRLGRFGFAARAAVAPTAAAAWAVSRFGAERLAVVPPARQAAALAPLPPEALRLDPAAAASLRRLGIRRIADLVRLPRAALAARFGAAAAERLDLALGRAGEPISPRRPPPERHARLAFAEPVGTAEALAEALRRLLARLCRELEADGRGARRLRLETFRVDGRVQAAWVGTSRPVRDPVRLARLFADPLGRIEPGLGIEAMVLMAEETGPLAPAQPGIGLPPPLRPAPTPSLPPALSPAVREAADPPLLDAVEVADLVDRLGVRLGAERVLRLLPRESHLPARAVAAVPAAAEPPPAVLRDGARAGPLAGPWDPERPRPLRLIVPPEPVEAVAPVPDDPPVLFRRGRAVHRVVRAEGPERVLPEWWRLPPGDPGEAEAGPEDFYRVEDEDGRRFWLCRRGLWRPAAPPPAWFLRGVFG
jgi:protein ImuB